MTVTDPNTLTAAGLAVLFLMAFMTGMVESRWSVKEKIRILEKNNQNLKDSVDYLTESNSSLVRSVARLSKLTSNTNEVVTAVSAIAQRGIQ